jgi:hypothetical protein
MRQLGAKAVFQLSQNLRQLLLVDAQAKETLKMNKAEIFNKYAAYLLSRPHHHVP